jgi:hypothetical protein
MKGGHKMRAEVVIDLIHKVVRLTWFDKDGRIKERKEYGYYAIYKDSGTLGTELIDIVK